MKKRFFILVLAFAITFSLLPTETFASEYSDIKGHWASAAISRWTERNVLKGYDDGTFRPDKTITRAELAVVINRMLKYPSVQGTVCGIDPSAWYYDDVASLLNWRYIYAPDSNFDVPITREEAVYMIYKSFGVHELFPTYQDFTDRTDIAVYAVQPVSVMKFAGFIGGYPDGSFKPKATITRAEVITILDNMIKEYIASPGAYSFDTTSRIFVNSSGVTLNLSVKNPDSDTADSRVFIPPSVSGEGAVTINTSPEHSVTVALVGNAKSTVTCALTGKNYINFVDLSANIAPVVTIDRPKTERMLIATSAMLNYISSTALENIKYALDRKLPTVISDMYGGTSTLSGWDIKNREELLSSLTYYTQFGIHSSQFFEEVAAMNALTNEQIEYYRQNANNGYMYPQTRDWGKKWGDTGIVSWDLFRTTNLVVWGIKAKYITYDEGLELLEPVTVQVAQHFDTWEDAYDNYLDGYAWWSRSDISSGRPREAHWEILNAFYPDVFDNSLLK